MELLILANKVNEFNYFTFIARTHIDEYPGLYPNLRS
jgi:hypothetical protein